MRWVVSWLRLRRRRGSWSLTKRNNLRQWRFTSKRIAPNIRILSPNATQILWNVLVCQYVVRSTLSYIGIQKNDNLSTEHDENFHWKLRRRAFHALKYGNNLQWLYISNVCNNQIIYASNKMSSSNIKLCEHKMRMFFLCLIKNQHKQPNTHTEIHTASEMTFVHTILCRRRTQGVNSKYLCWAHIDWNRMCIWLWRNQMPTFDDIQSRSAKYFSAQHSTPRMKVLFHSMPFNSIVLLIFGNSFFFRVCACVRNSKLMAVD